MAVAGSRPPAGGYKYLVLKGNESVLMKEALETRSWWTPAADGGVWNLWWGGNGQRFPWASFPASGKRKVVVNQVEGHREVTTKTGLAASLVRVAAEAGTASCSFAPETHVLGAKSGNAAAMRHFLLRNEQIEAEGGQQIWIVKPATCNRGRGIKVYGSCAEVVQHLEGATSGSSWVVQKYIENPLLVGGRKFDIRAYVLITPDGKAHLHREAYARTSCQLFNMDDLSDRSAHLTNDAVQKKLEGYHDFEDHCKLSLQELQDTLGPAVDVFGAVVPQMRRAATQLFGSVGGKLNPFKRMHCFELLGLDFMIDTEGKVFLIEVNTSPALSRTGRYLTDLLPRVIEECVQKSVDPYFPPADPSLLPEPLHGFQRLPTTAPNLRMLLRRSTGSFQNRSSTSTSTLGRGEGAGVAGASGSLAALVANRSPGRRVTTGGLAEGARPPWGGGTFTPRRLTHQDSGGGGGGGGGGGAEAGAWGGRGQGRQPHKGSSGECVDKSGWWGPAGQRRDARGVAEAGGAAAGYWEASGGWCGTSPGRGPAGVEARWGTSRDAGCGERWAGGRCAAGNWCGISCAASTIILGVGRGTYAMLYCQKSSKWTNNNMKACLVVTFEQALSSSLVPAEQDGHVDRGSRPSSAAGAALQ